MKANSKRKVFGDAVDLLMGDMEEVTMPRGVQMVPVKNIQAFHDHPFHLYEGERLEDMIVSVKEHGVLNPVIVQKLDTGYEMLSGHNRWNAAKLAGIKEIPAIVKTDLSEEEAYVYVIETNLMQRSFSDLAISEKAAVLKARYEKEACQGKRNDILEEIARLEGKEISITRGHDDHRLKTRDMIGKEYELSGSSVGRLLKLNDLIKPFKDMNLCLCPNCASEYKKMRADEYDLECFLEDIENLSDAEIGSMDPVEVAFGNETIWFTQTHIAEIRELRALQEAVDKYKDSTGSGVLTENIRQLVNRVEGNGCGILDLAELFIQEKQSDMSESSSSDELKRKKEVLFTKIMENGNGDIDKDLAVYFWKEQTDLETCLHDVIIQDMEKITGMTVYESPDKLWQQAIRKEDGSSNPDAIQVISPYRGEFYGTGALNTLMQNDFNPYWSSRYNLDGISYFDKVIQFRNRPKSDMAYAYNQETRTTEQHEVFNGEIGLVLMHPFDSKNKRYKYLSTIERFQVAFSNRNRQKLRYNYGREYGKNDKGWNLPEQKPQDNLELAYAISVHKSQGSEFDYVYIVIPKRDSHLLSMELLYTAITRAQKKVTIFLQEDIGTLSSLGHIEKSAVRRINSSVFKFVPLPEELLYIQNWYADEKKLATLSEYFVRSKSEVIIANMLVQEEVPFVYEEPLFAPDGTMFLPDFTVKFRGETYYWEHVGRLDLPDYRAHWEIKEKWYEKHFPGKLLTTFEGKDLSTDAMGIIKDHK